MIDEITAEQWRGVLDDVEPATYAEVAFELTERVECPAEEVRGAIDDALDAGVLTEDTSGAFALLTVGTSGADDKTDAQDTDNDTAPQSGESDADILGAFSTAVDFFADQLDTGLPDAAEYDTPRQYFREGRGWSDQTIADKRLGFAPADDGGLLDRLMSEGYGRDAILGTGLFTDSLEPLWHGQYVFPYFNADGEPCYAISRTTDHPADWFQEQKYAKAVKNKDYSWVDEPIYGLETIRDGEPVVITEGIADAISAHQASVPCISPVTTQFKDQHHEPVLDALNRHGVPTAFLIQDAERPPVDVLEIDDDETADSIRDALTIQQHGPGEKGAVKTGAYLADNGVDARIGQLPRAGLDKVDLDDYLNEWAGDDALAPITASARPATEHPAYDAKQFAREQAEKIQQDFKGWEGASGDGTRSAVFDLDVFDVAGISSDYRGVNPLGHHGNSEGYCTPISSDGPLYDHKYKVAYNGITYLLCEADERRDDSPGGRLDDDEVLAAWVHAKDQGYIPADDPIPHRALRSVAISEGLCTSDEIEDGWRLPIEARNAALDVIYERHGVEPGREPLRSGVDSGAARFCEECEPPTATDADPIDVASRRDDMTGSLYDEFLGNEGVTIWAHNPGEGKTTSAAIGAAERDRKYTVLLPKHENCREFQRDDMKPDGHFHLKGAAQPRDDACMDARVAEEECSAHLGDCPTMCPIYSELRSDSPTRKAFDALAGTVGVRRAHETLNLPDEDWHGDECTWLEQWDKIDSVDRIVTVHDYASLKSVRTHGDVIIDDLQGSLIDEQNINLGELALCRQALQGFAEYAETDCAAVTMTKLAKFVDELTRMLSDATADTATLADVPVPDLPTGHERTFRSRSAVPDCIPESEITERTAETNVGQTGAYTATVTVYEAEVPDLAETLAEAKREYNGTLIMRIRDGRWSDTPFCMDSVFAALAAAGADSRECRIAAATPNYLSECPRCGSRVAPKDGRMMCTEGGCGWTEGQDPLTSADDTPARIDVAPTTAGETIEGITTRTAPIPGELPDPSDVLVLDATPRKRVTAALFGVGEDQVAIAGDDAYSLPHSTVTQIIDGAYHLSTLKDSLTARQRTQSAIERINDMHDDVIYVTLKKALDLFEWPHAAEVMNYYALRGLDRDADAVVCVGAPHPAEDAMRADARVLSQDNPRIRSGGTELSTRNESEPAVYRKYNYAADDGAGRAIASKTYTGLTGDIFDGSHTDEIEQAAHRNRPILGSESDERHIYLLTNVATGLPLDRLTGFDAFLNPTEHHLDVRDSALKLLDAMTDGEDSNEDYAADGGVISIGATVTEWHEVAQGAGMDVSKSTISRALGDLRDCGLVKEGRYAQRRGKLQTLTELGAWVAARNR